MTMISRSWLILCMVFAVFFVGLSYKPVSAKTGYGWSPDEKVPGYLDDTFPPFLLAGQNRTVHAFTSQRVNEDNRLAIVYRQWTLLGGWTRPVDIILSPMGGDANFLGAYIDSSDMLHVIFSATYAITRETFVYYSSAPAANADWAPAWSTPVVVGEDALGLNSGAIVGDRHGNLVVIYSGDQSGSGVYSIYSKDAGKNWSSPQPVFLTYDSGLSAYSLRLTVGTDQNIRGIWNVVTNLGVDEALIFANFDSKNFKWNTPIELDRRINDDPAFFGPSYPSIVDNGNVIVVAYNSGNPFSDLYVDVGRPVKLVYVSIDGGLTWKGPSVPFPLHNGRSGEDAMTLDSSGNPHLLFIQRIDTTDSDGENKVIGGIWHSVFHGGNWGNLDRIATTVIPHDVHTVVSQGNILLVVWREDPGGGRKDGVWYSYKVLDAPELPVIPLATVPANNSVVSNPTTVPFSITVEPSLQPTLNDDTRPSKLGNDPAFPIVVGIVPVLLILIGIVVGLRIVGQSHR